MDQKGAESTRPYVPPYMLTPSPKRPQRGYPYVLSLDTEGTEGIEDAEETEDGEGALSRFRSPGRTSDQIQLQSCTRVYVCCDARLQDP
jgi:hypothetical protein